MQTLAALLLLAFIGQASTLGIDGTWRGTLATGAADLRLVVQIAQAPDGLLTGSLISVDQNSTIPIDRITVTGDAVRIEVKAVAGTFEGTLNAARNEMKGVWSQGAPLPLVLIRDATPAAAGGESTKPPVAAPPASYPLGLPLDLAVPLAPTPFTGSDGRQYLAYEVHVTNFGGRDILLTRLEVRAGDAAIRGYEATELNGLLAQPGAVNLPDRRTLPAGRRAVAFLWIPIDPGQSAPAVLHHRVTSGEFHVEGARTVVSTTPPVSIGPPLRGSDWLAVNGPGPASGHRRALIATEGGAHIAQRFAIDFVQSAPGGPTFSGDPKDNKSYRAYGADVLAVAAGTVAATKDGIPENVPGLTSRAVPITSETIGGNYVVLDLGSGRFAFYAHLQPGSLRVKVGDRVAPGQVLGLLGNSGNSTEPHLHFHVSNGVTPLGSDGLPYRITGMTGMPLQNARVSFSR